MDKKFSGIHLFSDIDGTLANTDDFLPEINRKAVEYFTENGGTFSIATGRFIGDLDVLDGLPINGLSILNNGSCIYDFVKKEAILEKTLDEIDVQNVIDYLKIRKDVGLLVVNGQGYTSTKIDNVDRPIFHERYAKNELKNLRHPFDKLLFVVDESNSQEVLDELNSLGINGADFVFTGERSIEMVCKGVSKGTAFQTVCDMDNIKCEDTFFVGDSFNDVVIMQMAGSSGCVGNAPSAVKECAKIELCPFEDGAVAQMINLIEENL